MTKRLFLALLLLMPLAARAQTAAQPELPKERLVVVTRDGARHAFNVEMAVKPEEQTVGLMWRTAVPPDGGMLFDWGTPRNSTMWMRNTLVSLDMVFINADGTIRSIAHSTTPRDETNIIDSRGPVRATLELAAGTAKRLGFNVADRVEHRIFTK